MGDSAHPSNARSTLVFFAPFIFGGVVAAIAYRVLDYLAIRPGPTPPTPSVEPPQLPLEKRKLGLSVIEAGSSGTGAGTVFVAVIAGSAAVGALICGMYEAMESRGGSSYSLSKVLGAVFEGAVTGITVGAGFGLLIAVPAAILVLISGKRDK